MFHMNLTKGGKVMRKLIRSGWAPVLLVLGIFAMGAEDCDKSGREATEQVSAIQARDMVETASNFQRLYKAVKPPQMTDSVERKNLVERLTRFNVPSKISYIYLISFGKVMSYYTIKGKVSSVNSMLTCTQQIVDNGIGRLRDGFNTHIVDSPDLDGSYGSNGDAIFFFTTENVYVEWNDAYLLCDQPLKLSTPPALVYTKKVK